MEPLPIVSLGLAAGRGERVRPLTLKGTNYLRSKAVIRFMGRRIIHWQLNWLQEQGVRYALIVAKGMENRYQIKSNVGYQYQDIAVFYSPPILDPLDTGSGDATIRNAAYFGIKDPVLVFPVDTLFNLDLRKLYDVYQETQADVVVVTASRCAEHIMGRYGVVLTDADNRIRSFQEKPTVEELLGLTMAKSWDSAKQIPFSMNAGIYLIRPEILQELNDSERLQVMRRDRLDFGHDLLPWMVKEQYKVYAYPASDVGDLGNIPDFLATMTRVLHGDMDLDWPQRPIGTPFTHRAAPRIHPTATVESSYLGINVQIGPYAQVRDSTLADDVIIEPYAEVHHSHLDEGCHIESYAKISDSLLGVMVRVHSSKDHPTFVRAYTGLGDEVTLEAGTTLESAIIDPRSHVYSDKVVTFT